MKKNLPFCSIIILNYFGERTLPLTLDSVLKLTYPKNLYEIIVIDNNSKDKSKFILCKYASKYKQIKLIFSKQNLGFSKGNNLGIKQAKGKYVVLLNNDCIVDKNWLTELVKAAERDNKIFSVNSKILFYPKYFILKIVNPKNTVIKQFYIYKSNLLKFTKEKKINFSSEVKKTYCSLEIPYDPLNDKEIIILLSFRKLINQESKNEQRIKIFNLEQSFYEILKEKITINEISYYIKIKKLKSISLYRHNKIQNAGVVVFQDGYGRDIGSIVRYQKQNYEIDKGQYEKQKEVYATCAAASLYRKEILKKIGYLDESFFMYYEDVEICERAKLNGYKCIYSPSAIARHLHALSSQEWSPFFIYHAEKGRLLHVFYNFPLRIFFLEFFKFALKSIGLLLKGIMEIKKWNKNIQHFKIAIYFLFNIPALFLKRKEKYKFINKNAIEKNYQKILEGYWYFNRYKPI